jgi:hypothetical protein
MGYGFAMREALHSLLTIQETDMVALNRKVDAVVDAYLKESGDGNKTAARAELARTFDDLSSESELSLAISRRIRS